MKIQVAEKRRFHTDDGPGLTNSVGRQVALYIVHSTRCKLFSRVTTVAPSSVYQGQSVV
jgi:3-deoxy-D-manno-octulosonate 8-phosphate phosphatase KdsC-like HAD superfamily phosphatase